ncbi:MAG: metal ABC transporter permease [Anaerolineaceae bacterium]
MINFLREVLSYEFMRNALLAGVIVSAACGVIGTLVVLNRIVFISGGIAHAAYGGVGIAYFLNLNPLWGAVGFSLLSSLAMGYVYRKEKARADTIIGVMWALGMALGIIFVGLSPGYKADLMSYLFGSILAVSTGDLWLMLVIAVVVLAFVLVFYRLLLAISYDETFSTVRNIPVGELSMAMIVLIGLTVVITMRVVGLILVIALLTIPPAIASLFMHEMRGIMILSTGLSLLFTISGLLISYALNLPSGAVIILVASLAYAAAAAFRQISARSRIRKETPDSSNTFEVIR